MKLSSEPASELKAWRAELGLSQSQAARALGVRLRTYQGWEAGRSVKHPAILLYALAALRQQLRHGRE